MRARRPRLPPPGSRSRPRSSSKRKPSAWPQPGTAVVGGAAADADHNPARSRGDRCQEQLAGAARGGDERVALPGGNQHQPRRRRHLDDGGLTVTEQAETGDDRLTERAGHLNFAVRAASRRDEGLGRSFAAVGHRHLVDRCLGHARTTPRAIAAAASRAVKLPLNLSGAITTRIVAGPDQARRPLTPCLDLQGVSSVDQASQCKHTQSTHHGPTPAARRRTAVPAL